MAPFVRDGLLNSIETFGRVSNQSPMPPRLPLLATCETPRTIRVMRRNWTTVVCFPCKRVMFKRTASFLSACRRTLAWWFESAGFEWTVSRTRHHHRSQRMVCAGSLWPNELRGPERGVVSQLTQPRNKPHGATPPRASLFPAHSTRKQAARGVGLVNALSSSLAEPRSHRHLVEGVIADDRDDLDDEERTALHRELDASIAEVDIGETEEFAQVLTRNFETAGEVRRLEACSPPHREASGGSRTGIRVARSRVKR